MKNGRVNRRSEGSNSTPYIVRWITVLSTMCQRFDERPPQPAVFIPRPRGKSAAVSSSFAE